MLFLQLFSVLVVLLHHLPPLLFGFSTMATNRSTPGSLQELHWIDIMLPVHVFWGVKWSRPPTRPSKLTGLISLNVIIQVMLAGFLRRRDAWHKWLHVAQITTFMCATFVHIRTVYEIICSFSSQFEWQQWLSLSHWSLIKLPPQLKGIFSEVWISNPGFYWFKGGFETFGPLLRTVNVVTFVFKSIPMAIH